MKKLHSKIILTVVVLSVLIATIFSINMFASPSYTKVTFVHGNSTSSQAVASGESIILPTPEAKNGGEVYGWFDRSGNFYECGESFSPDKPTTLYCAEGGEIALSGSFPFYLSRGYSYIKLNSNITVNSQITVPDGIVYIDLNGNNLSLNTATDGFVGENFGLIIANSSSEKSTFTHTADGEESFSLNSLVSVTPNASASNLSFVIGENVSLKANMNLYTVTKDISAFDGAVDIEVYGSLECTKILRSNNISGATLEVFEGAEVTTNGEFFFEDVGGTTKTAASLIVHGGTFNVNKTTSYAADTSRFKALIYGGSYSTDTTKFFPLGNYKSTYNSSTSMFDFSKCEHVGALIEHAPDCTTDITLDHFCKYCEAVYEKRYPQGVGHSYLPELTQDIVNTPEKTEPGCYTLTCTKCGHSTKQYTYPDPATVYVTVGFVDIFGKEQYVRFPSTDLFSFDGSKLLSFSADALYYDRVNSKGEVDTDVYIQQTSVFYIEIPLGTTEIFGSTHTYNGTTTPTGVFLRNDHLKIVEFPVSVKKIGKYAFSTMSALEKVIGIENVSELIEEYAFAQTASSKFVMDEMTLNAKTIQREAFKNARMKILNIGASVGSIGQGAFALEAGITSNLKEIFVEGNTLGEGKTLQEVFAYQRKSYSGGHQFDGLGLVFFDHNYKTVSIPSTCTEYGYDLLTCDRCGYAHKSNFLDEYAEHSFVEYSKPATCQTLGFIGRKCTVCNFIKTDEDLWYDKNVHTYDYAEVKIPLESGTSICVDPYYTLSQCKCGAIEPNTPENRSEIYQPAAGADHKWKETVIIANSCGTWGLSRYDCTVCRATRNAATEPKGAHNWEYFITVKATCQEGAKGYAKCSVCAQTKDTSSEAVDPNAHTKRAGDVGVVVTEPTEIHTGSKKYNCALCGYEFYEDIPALGKIDDGSIDFVGIRWRSWVTLTLAIVSLVVFIVLLLIGIGMTFIFTFTKKRSKARGYKFGFNTISKAVAASKSQTIADQLAEMNLSEELPPEVEIGENGLVDEEAAFTAYMDAISGFDATRELNIEEDVSDEVAPSAEDAWQAYVDAINKEYEETMEISLREAGEQKSFADMMDETVINLDIPDEAPTDDTAEK